MSKQKNPVDQIVYFVERRIDFSIRFPTENTPNIWIDTETSSYEFADQILHPNRLNSLLNPNLRDTYKLTKKLPKAKFYNGKNIFSNILTWRWYHWTAYFGILFVSGIAMDFAFFCLWKYLIK